VADTIADFLIWVAGAARFRFFPGPEKRKSHRATEIGVGGGKTIFFSSIFRGKLFRNPMVSKQLYLPYGPEKTTFQLRKLNEFALMESPRLGDGVFYVIP
jgi:hypothetical protein